MACSVKGGSLEEDASSGRQLALTVTDGSGAESRQVGVGGQVRSPEDSEFHGISGTARSPTHDSPEAAQSASQRRATPRTGILSGSPRSEIPFQSFPGSSTPQNTGSVTDSQLLCMYVGAGLRNPARVSPRVRVTHGQQRSRRRQADEAECS